HTKGSVVPVVSNIKLLDHFVCPCQHVGWDRQAYLLGSFQIDDELELLRLLHGEIGGLGSFQNLVHVGCAAPIEVGEVGSIGHQATADDIGAPSVDRRKPIFCR